MVTKNNINAQKSRYAIGKVIPLEEALYECQRAVDNGIYGRQEQKQRDTIRASRLEEVGSEVIEQVIRGDFPENCYKERLKISIRNCLGHIKKIPGYFRRN